MRRLAIWLAVAALVSPLSWFFTSRWCALLADQFYTPRLAVLQANPIGWNGTWLQLGASLPHLAGPPAWSGPGLARGGHMLDLNGPPGPDYQPIADLRVDADGRLVLHKDGRSFVFGPRAGYLGEGDDAVPAFAAEPGDSTSAVIDCSLLSWPAPYQVNWMTGYTPSWQRYFYYRLLWRKASGARLDIVWRHRQDYDPVNGWTGALLKEWTWIDIRG